MAQKKQAVSKTRKTSQATKTKQINKVEKKDNSTKYLMLFIVVIAFSLVFALLISKHKNDSYMNDLESGNFKISPQVGKVIVARDLDAIYPKYYVAYTEDDSYSIYVFNYYETVSQYE